MPFCMDDAVKEIPHMIVVRIRRQFFRIGEVAEQLVHRHVLVDERADDPIEEAGRADLVAMDRTDRRDELGRADVVGVLRVERAVVLMQNQERQELGQVIDMDHAASILVAREERHFTREPGEFDVVPFRAIAVNHWRSDVRDKE